MTIHGWHELSWDGDDLIFRERVIATIIHHKEIENHWHIKFEWRDAPTPEFFNIYNVKENARSICLARLNNNIKKQV